MLFKTDFFSRWHFKVFMIMLMFVFILFCIAAVNSDKSSVEKTAYLNNDDQLNKTVIDKNTDKTEESKPKEALVVIDPGHGGEDLGTCYGDLYEKNANLDVSLKLGKLLQKSGVKVVFTRDRDDFVGLKERSDIANDLGADLFISIHHNKMPDNPSYKGTETLYSVPEKTNTDAMDGEKFAKIVQSELVKTLKTYDNGIIYRPNLSVLHHTKMPAVIAEIGYISNRSERERIESGEFRQRAAEALDSAIVKVLEQMKANKSTDGKWLLADR